MRRARRAGLRHANIVQVVDFGMNEADGSHYLALELVDGMDLRALMQREGRFDAELVTLIAAELAAALAYAHASDEGRAAVVHRDLSPSNVLISRAGEVKLTDFGIARVIGGAHRTASGVIKGKVPYMPPEYIDGGRFDARGDLFSLGVMLYELCHGRRPFDGDSELDTLRRIAAGERRPFEVAAPPAFVACVDRLLQRRPEVRYQSALELLDSLPAIAVHQTRQRLSTMVRGRASLPPTDSLIPGPLARREATVPLSPALTPVSATDATRTRRSSWGPGRPALVALAGSLGLSLLVALGLLIRSNLQPVRASTRPVPEVPALPSRAPVASPPFATGSGTSLPAALDPVALAGRLAGADEDERAARPASELERTRPSATPRESARASTSRQMAELRVVVYPFGDIWVDDKHAGQSPLTLRLTAGTHQIAVGEGRAREHRTVKLHAGENESLTFRNSPPQP